MATGNFSFDIKSIGKLHLRYHFSIVDDLADLGRAEEIGWVFADFQKYLYQQQAAA